MKSKNIWMEVEWIDNLTLFPVKDKESLGSIWDVPKTAKMLYKGLSYTDPFLLKDLLMLIPDFLD